MGLHDTQLTDLTAAQYIARFPEIGVALNRDRFLHEQWPVRRHLVTDRDELLSYFTFFRKSLGRVMPHFLHWLMSRQMRVGEALEHFHRIPTEHRASIDHFIAAWSGRGGRIDMDLPTYQFAGDKHFIMDGNHRACAIALAQKPFRLWVYSVEGPRDADALVDVMHCR